MRYSEYAAHLRGILRIVISFLFMIHGTQKLFGYPLGEAIDLADIATMIGTAGVLECICGFFVMIGFATRPLSFILSGEMAFAYFLAHAPEGLWPIQNGGEPAILYCFIFLYFSSAGAGKFSIDTMRGYE